MARSADHNAKLWDAVTVSAFPRSQLISECPDAFGNKTSFR